MIRTICLAIVLLGVLWGRSDGCFAKTPLMSVVVQADHNAKFGTLLPIMELLQVKAKLPVSFELCSKPGVAVSLRIRSDAIVRERAILQKAAIQPREADEPRRTLLEKEWTERLTVELQRLGVDAVSLESQPYLPTSDFSQDELRTLRQQKRSVMIICYADWSVASQAMEETLLRNEQVIAAAKASKTVIMLADMTNRLKEQDAAFFRQHRASVNSFIHYQPDQESANVIPNAISAADFIKLMKPSD